MPLLELSHNIQEMEAPGRKRSHEEFSSDELVIDIKPVKGSHAGDEIVAPAKKTPSIAALLRRVPSPANSSPASLTDARSSTPGATSPSPNTTPTPTSPLSGHATKADATTMLSTSQARSGGDPPPPKRKKISAEEKKLKAEEEALRRKEKEEEKARKLEEKEEEKARKHTEKVRQEAEKLIAKAAKQAEKAKAEADRQEAKAAKQQERDDKRRKKEEEEKRIQEEKEKKERSQMKLGAFFKLSATPKKMSSPTPVLENAAENQTTETPACAQPKEKSEYDQMFQPFYIKEHVRLAPTTVQMDAETKETKTRILDEYISGQRGSTSLPPFDPVETLHLMKRPKRRGMLHRPVKGIMEDLQSDEAKKALSQLKRIPMKLLCFKQDVRPPYYGTLTCQPHELGAAKIRKAACRPNDRVLDLLYDYDSEAEWQDDGPGDDLDEMDDEEDDVDGEDDMDGFLDDSDDVGLSRRVFMNGMEPESTGICFEDRGGGSSHACMRAYRMEIMMDGMDETASIDPFSGEYWPSDAKKAQTTKATESKASKSAAMAPPPAPVNAFQALEGKVKAGAQKANSGPDESMPENVSPEVLGEFKRAILANQKLSKLGIVDVISHTFDQFKKSEVRTLLEAVAERRGTGRVKLWELKKGHEL